MSYKEIKTLKGKVEYCLRKYPETRNSDTKLTIRVWKEFYGEYISESPDSRFGYLNLDNLTKAIYIKIKVLIKNK